MKNSICKLLNTNNIERLYHDLIQCYNKIGKIWTIRRVWEPASPHQFISMLNSNYQQLYLEVHVYRKAGWIDLNKDFKKIILTLTKMFNLFWHCRINRLTFRYWLAMVFLGDDPSEVPAVDPPLAQRDMDYHHR